MNLDAYLNRIGYTQPVQPDYATLDGLHRAHLRAIPYENLDIHLGQALPLDQAYIVDKIVSRRRGGWCFEMNGLLAWALSAIGFDVTMLASAVGHSVADDGTEGHHLILLVKLDRPYLVDVGFANGLYAPIPLEEGEYTQGFRRFRLVREGERWRFHNHGASAGFVFSLQPRRFDDFAANCAYLQTSPESGFVRSTVCARFTPDSLAMMRGAVLTISDARGDHQQTLDTQDAFDHVLRHHFDLSIPEIAPLWQKVWARHQEFMATRD